MAKEFPKNVFVKKSKFGTKVSFKVDDFIAELIAKKDATGWARFEIFAKKNNPEEFYAAWDNWVPDANYKGKGKSTGGGSSAPYQSRQQPPVSGIADDLPF